MLHKALKHAAVTFCHLSQDSIRFFFILLKSRSALAAENLFLCKQLALYQERNVASKRATDATRLSLVLPGKMFEWKGALRAVRMETFIDWHRKGFKLFWRWKSRRIGRPGIPKELRGLHNIIAEGAAILSLVNIGKECQRHPDRLLRFYCATHRVSAPHALRLPNRKDVQKIIVLRLVIPNAMILAYGQTTILDRAD